MKSWSILTINPGSTSTKVGVYKNSEVLFTRKITHSARDLEGFSTILEELPLRERIIEKVLKEEGFSFETLDAVAGRGGLLRPIPCGTYSVSPEMVRDLKEASREGGHASNLGGLIASRLGEKYNIPAYIVDPVMVDEMMDEARITGLPRVRRKSVWHALNQKAVAHRAAEELKRPYEELNLIIAHLGGGITIGAHRKGKTVDVNDGLNGDGPFSSQRTGSLPAADVVELSYSGEFSKEELLRIIRGKGGLLAYFGTQESQEVYGMIERGDKKAELVFKAMAYQISCSIAAMTVPLGGNIDALILTGGLAYEESLVAMIKKNISFLGKLLIYPGEDELQALAQGVLRVLKGEEESADYLFEAEKLKKKQSLLFDGPEKGE